MIRIKKRLHFKGFSKKKFEQILFRKDILIVKLNLIKTNLRLLRFTKSSFGNLFQLTPSIASIAFPLGVIVRPALSNEAKAAQFVENYSLVGGASKLPNELDLLDKVFSSNILNLEESSLDSISADKDELYQFLCTHPNIQFKNGRDKFEILYTLASDCVTGKIQTQKQLQDALQIRGGFDGRVVWQLLVILILVIMLNNDVNGFNVKPLPHIDELFKTFSSSNLNKSKKFLYSFRRDQHCTFIPPMKNKDFCKPNEQGSTVCPATTLQNNGENENNNWSNCFDTKLPDNRRIFITCSQARKKGYHMPDFLSDNEITQLGGNPKEIRAWEKGKSPDKKLSLFNPRKRRAFYAARWEYFHDTTKVPEALVIEFAKRLIQIAADPERKVGKGQMGSQKTPGTVIFIPEERKVIFSNEEGEIRSAATLSGDKEKGQWANFITSGKENGIYVLFPGKKL